MFIIPRPPLWDRTINCDWVEFKSGGDQIRGYLAAPKDISTPRPAIILLHENIGVIEHRQDFTRRLAGAGFFALTVDMFSRLGGQPPQGAATPDERRAQAFLSSADEMAIPDMEAGVDYLQSLDGVDASRMGAIGHCSGGGTLLAWLAGRAPRIKAAVAFYPNLVVPGAWRADGKELSRLDVLSQIVCPLQIHFGSDDLAVPKPQRDALKAALPSAQSKIELHEYAGANHAFQDDTHPNYQESAASLSWNRALAFLSNNS